MERGRYTSGQSYAKGSRSSRSSSSSSSRSSAGRARSSSSRSSAAKRRSTSGRSSSAHRASQRSSSHYGHSSYGRSSYSGRRNPRRRRFADNWWIGIAALVVLVAAVALVFAFKGKKPAETEAESTEMTTTVPETELKKEVMVDDITITGMSRDAAKAAILSEYPWAMQVKNGEEVYEVANLMETKVDALLDEIFMGEPKENYQLDTHGLEEAVAAQAEAVAQLWDKKAKNGSISSFDEDANKFVFSGAEPGTAVDQEKLIADISGALERKEFDAVITAAVNTVQPEFDEETAREKYKTVSTFTTNSSANSKRNTNLKLACRAINGVVLKPGEEFSFNNVVGERTEAKGYQAASAYSNGEVVQEIGGGVCQVSTTLYNAVLRAGLKTTTRRSHTYEPSYVTPGMDATVSFNGPDYKFVNNSSTAVGIRASYSDQVVTVSIYAIPILEEGVKYTLKSTKLKETDPPAPTYEEDQTLQPNEERLKSEGTKGSYWETRLIITKDGETISDEVDHNTTYRGHAPVVLRNTSGVVIAPENVTTPAQTEVHSEGAADGLVATAGESTAASETTSGNRNETSRAETSRAETSRAETSSAAPTTGADPGPVTPGPTSAAPTAGNTPGTTAAPDEIGPGFNPPGAPISGADVIAPNPLGGQ